MEKAGLLSNHFLSRLMVIIYRVCVRVMFIMGLIGIISGELGGFVLNSIA
jgi:hypothetical protein